MKTVQIAKKNLRSKGFLFQFRRIEYILIPDRLSVMQTFALVRLVENIPVIWAGACVGRG